MKINKLPLIFVDHWSPMRILWEKLHNKVKWVLIISAHYERNWNSITVSDNLETIYDFYWFPNELYQMNYNVKTDKGLIDSLKDKFNWSLVLDKEYWIDHWWWSVLKKMFPNADKKVVLLSVNALFSNSEIFNIWNQIKNLREEWYLIIWSWNILHNFSELDFYNENKVDNWALELNESIKKKILNNDFDDLIKFENMKNSNKAFKSSEHYKPLLYILWAVWNEKIEYLSDEITNWSLSNNLILFWDLDNN